MKAKEWLKQNIGCGSQGNPHMETGDILNHHFTGPGGKTSDSNWREKEAGKGHGQEEVELVVDLAYTSIWRDLKRCWLCLLE